MPDIRSGDDPFDLRRFVSAQSLAYERACDELRAGRKQSHWMWFIFPQMRGLGHSSMAEYYGIASLDEARAYLDHPTLGPRLCEVTRLMLAQQGGSSHAILGSPDDMKFRSSMTLFSQAAGPGSIFAEALQQFCDDVPDEATRTLLGLA